MIRLIQVSAGHGPEEVAHFVALLGRRLEHRCAELGLAVTARTLHGPASAPRSLTLRIEGASIELLRAEEEGSHALIARSSVHAERGRKRWFAGVVFITPTAASPSPSPSLRLSDLELTACRSGGPGGQNVNKRSTAVRVRHQPTGLTVRVDARRRQSANRRLAVDRLAELLRRREAQLAAKATASQRSNHWQIVRGKPVRIYRLDLRGELEELT